MCGRRSRARCCGGAMAYPTGGAPSGYSMIQGSQCGCRHRRRGPISGLVGLAIAAGTTVVNNRNEKRQLQESRNTARHMSEEASPYHSVVPAHPVHEDKQAVFQEPPMYTEEDMYQRAPENPSFVGSTAHQTRPQSEKANASLKSFARPQISNPATQLALEVFTAHLAAYRNGSGKKWTVKSARKDLMNKIYDAEVKRRESLVTGSLKCGERSEIWREVELYGNELWDMVNEAKRLRQSY